MQKLLNRLQHQSVFVSILLTLLWSSPVHAIGDQIERIDVLESTPSSLVVKVSYYYSGEDQGRAGPPQVKLRAITDGRVQSTEPIIGRSFGSANIVLSADPSVGSDYTTHSLTVQMTTLDNQRILATYHTQHTKSWSIVAMPGNMPQQPMPAPEGVWNSSTSVSPPPQSIQTPVVAANRIDNFSVVSNTPSLLVLDVSYFYNGGQGSNVQLNVWTESESVPSPVPVIPGQGVARVSIATYPGRVQPYTTQKLGFGLWVPSPVNWIFFQREFPYLKTWYPYQ